MDDRFVVNAVDIVFHIRIGFYIHAARHSVALNAIGLKDLLIDGRVINANGRCTRTV